MFCFISKSIKNFNFFYFKILFSLPSFRYENNSITVNDEICWFLLHKKYWRILYFVNYFFEVKWIWKKLIWKIRNFQVRKTSLYINRRLQKHFYLVTFPVNSWQLDKQTSGVTMICNSFMVNNRTKRR